MSSVADTPRRIKSDPPPALTVEDTGSGAPPQPSPSPTQTRRRSFRPFPVRPKAKREDSTGSIRERKTHKRKHSPNLEWHEKWTKDSWKQGRVLLIDYVGREHKAEGRRKIVAQEFADIDGLRKFYRNQNLSQQAALRVIHVQNASWATRFLLRKFNIDASDDLVGTTFGRWARYERPQQRGGKPVLNGKTFRPQRDPWRGISRAAFGCDYLKHSDKRKHPTPKGVLRMMELNCYDASDQPIVGYDVNVQRLSVYVQLSDGVPGEEVDPDIPNPYNEEEYEEYQRLKRQYGAVGPDGQEQYIPKLKTLDNGSTIIIFENSPSGNVQDTLIGARQEIEARWRRLTFYLPREEMESDEMLATECMDFILRDILKALAFNWEKFVNICETHVGILEDKLYENPADESRAPELWTNSSLWLKVERLLYIHLDIAKEMRSYLRELALGDPKEDEPWLGNTAEELEKLTTQWEEGVVKPTTNLSDLLYKSVGIRDARHSLQLGLSMWRLSWITFIFLPLTFVCGFFGMNVDTFESNPPIKWFFISIFPLFTIVIISWYFIKHTLNTQRQNPLRRGIYETFYAELAQDHPSLWTRHGPKKGIIPIGWYNSIKWRLATRWFGHDKMAPGQTYDAAGQDELGVGNRVKRYLVERWLKDLIVAPKTQVSLSQPDLSSSLFEDKDLGAVQELLSLATPIALAEGDPTAASRLSKRIPLERYRSLSPTRSEGDRPGSSVTSGDESGVMVEEEVNASEDERSVASGDEASENKRKRSSFPERLNVPLYPGGAGIVAGGL